MLSPNDVDLTDDVCSGVTESSGYYDVITMADNHGSLEKSTGGILEGKVETMPASKRWEMLALFIIVVAGITGNVLVCLAVGFEKKLQNVTNYFLVSLAVADLFVSLVVMPGSIAQEFMGRWPFGLALCSIWQICDVTMCTSSIMHMCTISLDRYMGIRYPIKTRNRSRLVVAVKMTAVWIVSLAIASPLVWLAVHHEDEILSKKNHCAINNSYFLIYGSMAAFFGPLVIMLVTYSLTIRLLSKRARQLERRASNRRTDPRGRNTEGGWSGGFGAVDGMRRSTARRKSSASTSDQQSSRHPSRPSTQSAGGGGVQEGGGVGTAMTGSAGAKWLMGGLSSSGGATTESSTAEDLLTADVAASSHRAVDERSAADNSSEKLGARGKTASTEINNRAASLASGRTDIINTASVGLQQSNRLKTLISGSKSFDAGAAGRRGDERALIPELESSDSETATKMSNNQGRRGSSCVMSRKVFTSQTPATSAAGSRRAPGGGRHRAGSLRRDVLRLPNLERRTSSRNVSRHITSDHQNSCSFTSATTAAIVSTTSSTAATAAAAAIATSAAIAAAFGASRLRQQRQPPDGNDGVATNGGRMLPDVIADVIIIHTSTDCDEKENKSMEEYKSSGSLLSSPFHLDVPQTPFSDRRYSSAVNRPMCPRRRSGAIGSGGSLTSGCRVRIEEDGESYSDASPCREPDRETEANSKQSPDGEEGSNVKEFVRSDSVKISIQSVDFETVSCVTTDTDTTAVTVRSCSADQPDATVAAAVMPTRLIPEPPQNIASQHRSPTNYIKHDLYQRFTQQRHARRKIKKRARENVAVAFQLKDLSVGSSPSQGTMTAGAQPSTGVSGEESRGREVASLSLPLLWRRATSGGLMTRGDTPSASSSSSSWSRGGGGSSVRIEGGFRDWTGGESSSTNCSDSGDVQARPRRSGLHFPRVRRSPGSSGGGWNGSAEDSEDQSSNGIQNASIRPRRRTSVATGENRREFSPRNCELARGASVRMKLRSIAQRYGTSIRLVAGIPIPSSVLPPPSSSSSLNAVNTERKAVKVLGTMFLIFVASWASFFITNLATGLCGESCEIDAVLFKSFLWLGYTSSMINPIVYTIFSASFKRTFVQLLKCSLCCYSCRYHGFIDSHGTPPRRFYCCYKQSPRGARKRRRGDSVGNDGSWGTAGGGGFELGTSDFYRAPRGGRFSGAFSEEDTSSRGRPPSSWGGPPSSVGGRQSSSFGRGVSDPPSSWGESVGESGGCGASGGGRGGGGRGETGGDNEQDALNDIVIHVDTSL